MSNWIMRLIRVRREMPRSSAAGALATLAAGQVAVVSTTQPYVVESQDDDHPFDVAAHMTCGATNGDGLGDPEFVSLVPPDQHLPRYLSVTDPTYEHTTLVVTRVKASDATFAPVSLDCLGEITGFVPVGASRSVEVAQVPLVRGGALGAERVARYGWHGACMLSRA